MLIYKIISSCGCKIGAGNSLGADINTLRTRQNGRHFADDIFKRIFFNENVGISIKISLKFVPKGPINNIPALVQIMAWRRTGDKPLSEPMMAQFNDAYMRHSASMSEDVDYCISVEHIVVSTGWSTICKQRFLLFSSLHSPIPNSNSN